MLIQSSLRLNSDYIIRHQYVTYVLILLSVRPSVRQLSVHQHALQLQRVRAGPLFPSDSTLYPHDLLWRAAEWLVSHGVVPPSYCNYFGLLLYFLVLLCFLFHSGDHQLLGFNSSPANTSPRLT